MAEAADRLTAQAMALKLTAEKMVDAKSGEKLVENSVRVAVQALITEAKKLHPTNPVIAALNIGPTPPMWSEVLMIANSVYVAA